MIRINLLPHREEKRKIRRQQFWATVMIMLVIAVVIDFLAHMVNQGYIDSQEQRNRIFTGEIAKLDNEIAEIRELRTKINDLLARKKVIEDLQGDRSVPVHLFNELWAKVPAGVYLASIKQTGNVVALGGYAQSNAKVSFLMRALDESPFLENAKLIKTEAVAATDLKSGRGAASGRAVIAFTLEISIERPADDLAEVADAAPVGGK
ncbi:MAG: PilN domain-containing protein [Azoarcus sp.]|jgi:type IV pilus assembly protein PilN|nr:PilN domain-containing protein [Azoarcus sp.]